MATKSTYTLDEHFIVLFRMPYIKRKSPNQPLELCSAKFSLFSAFGVLIIMFCFLTNIFKYNFQGSDWKTTNIPECAAGLAGCLIALYREWTFMSKKEQINRVLRKLDIIFPITYEAQKNYQMHYHAKGIIKKNNTVKFVLSNTCIILVLFPIFKSIYVSTILNKEYPFLYPFLSWNAFSHSSFLRYALIYLFQAATVCGGTYIWVKDDVIIVTFVAQLCMHYQYLGETLSKLDATKEEQANRKLVELIRFQYTLDGICNDINQIFSFSNFFAFNIIRIYVGMQLFSLIQSTEILTVLTAVMSSSALSSSIFLRCLIGNRLFDVSSNLFNSIYEQNWYEGTPKYRKTILTMMIRAYRPMELRSYKLKTICMVYFKEIVVSTYEIFMFLYKFTKK